MIKTENLSFSYKDNDVIHNINLKIEKGSFTVVLGRNGSGKSTLAKHFNAILLPCGGAVYVDSMNTKDESKIFDIRSKAGMVFQNPDNQMVAAIVEDEIAFAPENLGISPNEIRRRVDECLKTVNMQKYIKASAANLSGGQKQLISIASVLATEPEYIILDEPTSMLDPGGREMVLETVKKLNQQKGITIILITHYMEEAVKADRVIVMDNGITVLDGTPREIFSKVEALKAIGLDVPQVTELAYELRKLGIDIKKDILSIDECYNEILRLTGDKCD